MIRARYDKLMKIHAFIAHVLLANLAAIALKITLRKNLQSYANFLQKRLDASVKISIIRSHRQRGWLAQLVEHLPYKQRVSGSIPLPPTIIE